MRKSERRAEWDLHFGYRDLGCAHQVGNKIIFSFYLKLIYKEMKLQLFLKTIPKYFDHLGQTKHLDLMGQHFEAIYESEKPYILQA